MRIIIFILSLIMTSCVKKNSTELNTYSRPQVDLEDLEYELENDILPENEGDENEDNTESDSKTNPE